MRVLTLTMRRLGVTAGETKNPIRNIPRVTRSVFWRILIFYISTVIIIGFNVPYDYPNLSIKSTATSPFTLVFQQAGSSAFLLLLQPERELMQSPTFLQRPAVAS